MTTDELLKKLYGGAIDEYLSGLEPVTPEGPVHSPAVNEVIEDNIENIEEIYQLRFNLGIGKNNDTRSAVASELPQEKIVELKRKEKMKLSLYKGEDAEKYAKESVEGYSKIGSMYSNHLNNRKKNRGIEE